MGLARNHPAADRARSGVVQSGEGCARHEPRFAGGMRRGRLGLQCGLALLPLLAVGCPGQSGPPAQAPIPPLPAARPHEDAPHLQPPPAPATGGTGDPAAAPDGPSETEVWGDQPLTGGEGDPIDAAPPPAPTEEVDPASVKPVQDGPITRLPGIRIWRDEKRIEVDGFVCIKQGPALELLGCTRRGKTHESLFLFDCAPEHLQLALILIGLQPTPQVNDFGQAIELDRGEKVVLEVSWKAEDAPQHDPNPPAAVEGRIRRWVEDVVYDRRRKGAMLRVGWVFTGSRQVKVPAPPDWKTEKEVFAAGYTGNVAAVYHDPDAILDTPLLEGGDDTLFYPYAERLPDAQTPVVFHVRPWTDADQAAYGENLHAPAPPGGESSGGAPDEAEPDGR